MCTRTRGAVGTVASHEASGALVCETFRALAFVGMACSVLELRADGNALFVDPRIVGQVITSTTISASRVSTSVVKDPLGLLFDFRLDNRWGPLSIRMVIYSRCYLRYVASSVVEFVFRCNTAVTI